MKPATATPKSAGAVFLIGAQAVFLVSSYALHMVIARVLGPAGYGVFGVVFNMVSILYVLVSGGVPQAVARYVGGRIGRPEEVKRRALALQVGVSAAIVLAYLLASVPIATLLADLELAPYIQVSALAIPAYALYSLWSGYLGGLHLFFRQALVVGLYALLKMLAVCVLAYAAGITGALVGVAVAPIGALLVALRLTPAVADEGRGEVGHRALLGFAGPFTIFAMATEAMTMVDLLLVKAIVGDDLSVGHYTAAATIGRVPYLLLIGLGTAVLPAMARTMAAAEPGSADYVARQVIRLVLLLIVPAVALMASTAGPIVDLLYSSQYAPAAAAVPLLTAGMSLSALFRVCASMESGAGGEKTSMAVALFALAVGLGAGYFLTGAYGVAGAAFANLLMGAVASAITLALIVRRHRCSLPLLTLVRSAVAALPIVAMPSLLPTSPAILPVVLLIDGVAYLLLLGALGELGSEELRIVRSLLPAGGLPFIHRSA